MGRPKLEIPRDRQLNVALTFAELTDVQRAARAAYLRPVDYARAKLFAAPGRAPRTAIAVPHLDPLLAAHLSRLGNNLNQIARQLHQFAIPAPAELAALLAEIRAALRMAQSK